MLTITPTLYAGYIISVHRMVMEIVLSTLGQHPGESPTCILHEDEIKNTCEQPSVKLVKASINNHIAG